MFSLVRDSYERDAINLSFSTSSRVLDHRTTVENRGGSASLKDPDTEVSNSRHVMLDNNAIVPSGFNARFA